MVFMKGHLKNLQIISAMIKAILYQLVSIWIMEPQFHNYFDVSQLNTIKSVIIEWAHIFIYITKLSIF